MNKKMVGYGLQVVAVCAFVLTQGCVTSRTDESSIGAGARRKGPWKHEHKGHAVASSKIAQGTGYSSTAADDTLYDPVIIESSSITESSVAPAPQPKVAHGTETYIVQKGDILSKIAGKFDTTTKTLISMNNLRNPDVLYVGQELKVPGSGGASSAPTSYSAKSSSSVKKGGTYIIQRGDTLSGIAVAANVSIDDLRAVNHFKGDKIYAGQKIYIPSNGKVPSVAHKTSAPAKSTYAPAPQYEAPAPAEPVVEEEFAPAPMATEPVVENEDVSVSAVDNYTVSEGETLDDIARSYNTTKEEIMRYNNISDESSVEAGDPLQIPISE